MAKLSSLYNDAQLINGIPATGGLLFTYAAGSSTKQTTFTDQAGLTAQSNPIVLNARGEPAQPIWLTEGQSYKFVFSPATDSDPPVSPIRTIDNITGINDASLTIDQWIDSALTPTYVNATQFTLPGDQTSAFQVNRRIKATVTAGTVYGYISVSAFAALTTVTVVLDSGTLDSGLSSVQLGLLTPSNTSLFLIESDNLADDAVTEDKLADDAVSTDKIIDGNVTLAKLEPSAKTSKIQPITASVGSNALTVTLNPTALDFRDATLGAGTINTRQIASAISVVVSSGSTLGSISGQQSTIAVLAIDNAGTIELAVVNLAGGVNLDESGVISTTAEGGAGAADSATVVYSTTARTNVPYRVVGFVNSTQATAGTWATAPSLIQGYGGQAVNSMGSLGYGQSWSTVTRNSGTTYYNTTGKPIVFNIRATTSGNNVTGEALLNINGGGNISIAVAGGAAVNQTVLQGNMIIPVGARYVPTYSNLISITVTELN
jgi:hypothetical protein